MDLDKNFAFDLEEPESPKLSIDVSRYLSEPDIPYLNRSNKVQGQSISSYAISKETVVPVVKETEILRSSTDAVKSANRVVPVPVNHVAPTKGPNDGAPIVHSSFPFSKRISSTSLSQSYLDIDLKSLRVRRSDVQPSAVEDSADNRLKCINQEVCKNSLPLMTSPEKACTTAINEAVGSNRESKNSATFSRTSQSSIGQMAASPIPSNQSGKCGLSTEPLSLPKSSPKANKLDTGITSKTSNISLTTDIGDCPSTLELLNSIDLSVIVTKPCSDFLIPAQSTEKIGSNSAGKLKQQSVTMAKNVLRVNNQQYQLIRVLGEGGSSKVYEVLDNQLTLRAIKCVNLRNADRSICESYMNEIAVLRRLQSSDRVVKLYDHEFNESQKMLYVVLERGDVDLATVIKSNTAHGRITPEMVKFYWSEMLRAVETIHKEGIIHSDLKPANFLLVAGQLKLIDFGIASMIPKDATSIIKDSRSGTFNYMSPEAFTDTCEEIGESLKIKIGVKSDVWSLGCILYHMVYRCTPFHGIKDSFKKMFAIVNPNYSIEFKPLIDGQLLDVLKKCIVRDPKQRPSISQLLQHPYLTGGYLTTPSPSNTPMVSLINGISELSPASIERVSQVVSQLKCKKKGNNV